MDFRGAVGRPFLGYGSSLHEAFEAFHSLCRVWDSNFRYKDLDYQRKGLGLRV